MFRIQHPVKLEGVHVSLVPLEEHHISGLVAAGADPRIWENLPLDGANPAKLQTELRNALLHRSSGTQYPFAIIEKGSGRLIGSTRLMELFPEHRKLEIGWTWYNPEMWGKAYNLECKLLLLGYCFETLSTNRVQLKTRDTNLRSQAAIKKIGGVLEGTLRKDRIMPDGNVRDTVVFSILDSEWESVKAQLVARIKALAS